MCRFLAYLGDPVRIGSLIVSPENALLVQSTAPRFQTCGDGNPDGWGIAWSGGRHRVTTPMHLDPETERVTRIESGSFLAAIRLATPGMEIATSNTPPYVAEGWSFAHNGAVGEWSTRGRAFVESLASETRLAQVQGTTDSELLFAAVLTAIDAGSAPTDALARTVRSVDEAVGGTLNLLLATTEAIHAVACGNSLFSRAFAHGAVLASEPFDDDDHWSRIPDRSVVTLDREGITIEPLRAGVETR